jgi:eukaryotic-like serine/threonine-protein kinase
MARREISYPRGERLPGTKYVVVRKLGQGGMGVVLEVVKEPGIRGVIKIIHPFLAAEPEFRQRFFDEVRILAKLDHPNIVKVTDFDQLADGTPYFAMELLNGSTVRQVLRATGVIHPTHLYQIMRGLLEGLEYVHTHDPPIVHRDIKSENVFIHAPAFGEPCVKVIDFGVAWGASAVEASGFVGTRRYAAPEQFRGGRVTLKADIYSAGLLLYEGLAGRGPFDDIPLIDSDEGNRMKAFARAHLSYVPPSIRTFAPWVPESIDGLLQSALAKEPEKRPESAYAFAAKLYVLQFMRDAPVGNTTIQNLNTMAQLSAVVEEAQDVGSGATSRRDEPSSSEGDSSDNTVLHEGPMPWLEEGARNEKEERAPKSRPTVVRQEPTVMRPGRVVPEPRLMRPGVVRPEPDLMRPSVEVAPDSVSRTLIATVALQPDVDRLAAAVRRATAPANPAPRSFAEAERAAAHARGVGIRADAFPSGPSLANGAMPAAGAGHVAAPQSLEKRTDWDANSLGRADETEQLRRLDHAGRAPSSGLGRLPLIALATVIPLTAVALGIFLLTRTPSSTTSPATSASPSTSRAAPSPDTTAPIPLLPQEDPPSASTASAAPAPPTASPTTLPTELPTEAPASTPASPRVAPPPAQRPRHRPTGRPPEGNLGF